MKNTNLIIISLFCFFAACELRPLPEMIEPYQVDGNIKFEVNNFCPSLPCEVCFTAQEEGNFSYKWEFGDGVISREGREVCHKYTDHGYFYVKLQISDDSTSYESNDTIKIIPETFDTLFSDITNEVYYFDLIELNDGYAIATASTSDTKVVIDFLSRKGEIKLDNKITFDNFSSGSRSLADMYQTSDNQLLITGRKSLDGIFDAIYAVKLDANGIEQSNAFYKLRSQFSNPPNYAFLMGKSFQTENDEIYFTSNFNRKGTVISKMNADGTFDGDFKIEYDTSECCIREGTALTVSDQDNIFLVGDSWIAPRNNGNFLARFSAGGQLSAGFPVLWGTQLSYNEDIIHSDDGHLIIIGSRPSFFSILDPITYDFNDETFTKALVINKFTKNGVPTFNEIIIDGNLGRDTLSAQIVKQRNIQGGDFLVLATKGREQNGLLNLYRFDLQTGNQVMHVEFPYRTDVGINNLSFEITKDGGYIIMLRQIDGALRIIKTDSRGKVW